MLGARRRLGGHKEGPPISTEEGAFLYWRGEKKDILGREEFKQRQGGFITLDMLNFLAFEPPIRDFKAFLWISAKYLPFLSIHLIST